MESLKETVGKVMAKVPSPASMTESQKSSNSPEQEKHLCEKCQKQFECEKYPHCYGTMHRLKCPDCLQEAAEVKRKRRLFEEAGVPTKFLKFDTDKKDALEEALRSDKGGFYYGKVGTGKTTFVASLIKRFTLEHGKRALYVSTADLVMRLQDMYRKEGESPYDYLKELAKIDVLCIDDLGTEKLTDFVKQAFYFLINEREQWERRTYITSNYNLDELDGLFSARISSRIAGMCNVGEFKGEDKRVKGGRV